MATALAPKSVAARLVAAQFFPDTFNRPDKRFVAFVRYDGDYSEGVFLANGEPLPIDFNDIDPTTPVRVVTWNPEQAKLGEDDQVTTGFTFGDVVAALEHPSEEYYLLDLRLYNDFHLARPDDE